MCRYVQLLVLMVILVFSTQTFAELPGMEIGFPDDEAVREPLDPYGYFSIRSDPSGADVIFDGVGQGMTPVQVRILTTDPGAHMLTIRKDGYQDWTNQVNRNPSPGSIEEISAVLIPADSGSQPDNDLIKKDESGTKETPAPQVGKFRFTSEPSGADVIFDESGQGITPLTIEVPSTVSPVHRIIIRKDGYEDWSSQITHNPLPDQTEEITVELIPISSPPVEPAGTLIPEKEPVPSETQVLQPGYISFESNPPGAQVILEKNVQGITPLKIEITSSTGTDHQVIFRKDGFEDRTIQIAQNPAPGETETISADLIPLPGPVPEPVQTQPADPVSEPSLSPVESPINDSDTDKGFFLINSVPPAGQVTFDGVDQGSAPVTVEINPLGTQEHNLQIQMAGYQDWTSVLHSNPLPGTTETINADLILIGHNGTIRVTSEPSGGLAVLDGSAIQTTPCIFADVPAGMHSIGISKDGYNPYFTNISVSEGAESVVSATLSPVTHSGSLTVSSNPDGALILLNNIAYGVTPAHIEAIASGTYQLKLVKHGYQTVTKTIEVIPGKDTPINVALPRLIPVTGSLTIRSFPSGGVVKVDAVERGVTPLKIRGLIPDSYNVRVSIPGYLSWIGIVDVAAGRDTSVYAMLSNQGTVVHTGTLSMTSEPSGATVTIDNGNRGRTPFLLQNLIPGIYQVTVSLPGYKSETVPARISADTTTELHVPLTQAPKRNLSADLRLLSDDAGTYFVSHGRTEALNAFEDPAGGFSRGDMYVIGMDLNGTVLSDMKNPDLVGINLSKQSDLPVNTGVLMTTLSRTGGGYFYDSNLSGTDPTEVSLIYVRPPISGVVIGTCIPVPEINIPETSHDPSLLRNAVKAAVIQTEGKTEEDILLMDMMSTEDNPEIRIQTFDIRRPEKPDSFGITNSRILSAASNGGTGYLWLLDETGTESMNLLLTYTEMFDENLGVFASWRSEKTDGEITMMSLPEATL